MSCVECRIILNEMGEDTGCGHIQPMFGWTYTQTYSKG